MLNEEIKNLSSFLFHLEKFRQKFNCISLRFLGIFACKQYFQCSSHINFSRSQHGPSVGFFKKIYIPSLVLVLGPFYWVQSTFILAYFLSGPRVIFYSNEAGKKPNIETGMKLVSCHVHSPYQALYWYKVGSSQRCSVVLEYECVEHQTTYHAQACIEQSIS
jgi:hypothetical protein